MEGRSKTWVIVAIIATALLLAYTGTHMEGSSTKMTDDSKEVSRTVTFIDKSGNTLEVVFSESSDFATVTYPNGSTHILTRQPSESGFEFTNGEFELAGEVDEITLRQNGEIVFVGNAPNDGSDITVCTQADRENVACTREYVPVCGDDGVTYGNACEACASGNINLHSQGACI